MHGIDFFPIFCDLIGVAAPKDAGLEGEDLTRPFSAPAWRARIPFLAVANNGLCKETAKNKERTAHEQQP
jgi:hypothetical protein